MLPSGMHRHSMVTAAVTLALFASASAQDGRHDWPVHAGDQAATRYAAIADINRQTVRQLAVAWTWKPAERALPEYGTQPGTFQNTPLMIDDVLYVSTPYNRVVALDARTGRELWRYDPEPFKDGQPPNGTGFVHRGVAAWRDESGQLRIFMNSRYRLICLDAKTGDAGIDIRRRRHRRSGRRACRWKGDRASLHEHLAAGRFTAISSSSATASATGSCIATIRPVTYAPSTRERERSSGRSGPIPRPGEFGHETWEDDSWTVHRAHERLGADVARRARAAWCICQ